jgi:SAM-dependent methyltransferase
VESDTYHFVGGRHDTYWWQRARRDLVAALLRRFKLQPHGRWLDLGCGPGGSLIVSTQFAPAFVAAVDISPIAIEQAAVNAPFAHIVRADLSKALPFADNSFDVVTILSVLYHMWISNEHDVLTEVRRVLRPGGLAVITEPAFPLLRRDMDRIGMARKRYRLREFTSLCRAAGLQVLFGSYFTSFGFPLILAAKAIRRLRALWSSESGAAPAMDMKPLTPAINDIMYRVARIEGLAVSRGIPIPFGTTLVVVVQKWNS